MRNYKNRLSVENLGPQLKAARALLGWKQTTLAKRSGLSICTVKDIERNAKRMHKATTVIALIAALEKGGVAFSPNGGVELLS